MRVLEPFFTVRERRCGGAAVWLVVKDDAGEKSKR